MQPEHDAIIVGGSFAGMAAALPLLRARRHVLVIDGGQPRNRFSAHAQGFLSRDGEAPGEILRAARTQLAAYPTLAWRDTMVTAIARDADGFSVTTAEGSTHRGRRVILASGLTDDLPDIEGLAERWGRTVFHCPYCHGYELGGGPIAAIAEGEGSARQAILLSEWGRVTLFLQDRCELTPEMRADVAARGIAVEPVPVVRVQGAAEVLLADGRRAAFDGIFVTPRDRPATPLAEALGCRLEPTPCGLQLRTNDKSETTVQGVYACGDLASTPHSIALAVASGSLAGTHVHASLVG